MNDRKPPWRPRLREEPMFNPFEPSTDWTRDLGANDRIEVPDEEAEPGDDEPGTTKESPK